MLKIWNNKDGLVCIYIILAEGPGVLPMEKEKFWNFFLKNKLSVHKKIQPIRSSRLVGYREHKYEFLVLWYRIQAGGPGVAPEKKILKK